MPASQSTKKVAEKPECFVIMPISTPDDYPPNHFLRVYEDILAPACELAGFTPVPPNQKHGTALIHEELLRKLLEAPMVLCDLSTRNPNVLFELGLRQAFDKPVTLIQEAGTPRIFDIAPLEYKEYRRQRLYDEVLEDQNTVADFIKETYQAWQKGSAINSLVRLLSIPRPASLIDIPESEQTPALDLVRAELSEIRSLLGQLLPSPRERAHALVDEGMTLAKLATQRAPSSEDVVWADAVITQGLKVNVPDATIIHALTANGYTPAWAKARLRILKGSYPDPETITSSVGQDLP